MFLTASQGGVLATNGITLGGGTILNNAPWTGKWTTLPVSTRGCALAIPAASAVVVKLSR